MFLINLPLAAIAVAITLRHVPESSDPDAVRHIDVPGAVLVSVGLAGVAYALIEGAVDFGPVEVAAAVLGVAALGAFVVTEARTPNPMLPLEVFRSRQFTGANLTTLAVYTALGGTTFLVVLQLQLGLGYSAVEAGASLLPITVLMVTLSARMGQLAQRTGPRLPMTVGPLVIAVGHAAARPRRSRLELRDRRAPRAGRVRPRAGDHRRAAHERGAGRGRGPSPRRRVRRQQRRRHGSPGSSRSPSSRPWSASTSAATAPVAWATPSRRPCASPPAFSAVGGLVAFLTVRTQVDHPAVTQPAVQQPCHDPCIAETAEAA